MKLGISQACYRWMVYSDMRRDGVDFLPSGRSLPYLQTLDPPPLDDPVEDWLLERVHDLGVESLYMAGRTFPGRVAAKRFRAKAVAAGVMFVGNVTFNIAARSRALSTFPAPPVSTRSQAPPKGRSHNYYKLETSLSPENRSIPLGYAEIEKDSV